MAEPPICEKCGGRHWFLDPCDASAPRSGQLSAPEPRSGPGNTEAVGASKDEIEKALRFYRAHKERQKNRMRQKRADSKKVGHKG